MAAVDEHAKSLDPQSVPNGDIISTFQSLWVGDCDEDGKLSNEENDESLIRQFSFFKLPVFISEYNKVNQILVHEDVDFRRKREIVLLKRQH